MTTATISSFENTLAKTNEWLDEIADQLGRDRQYGYRALRAVLHALRDRLPVAEASDLAAQLPMLVRGLYYEGWNPSETPRSDERDRESFLRHVAGELDPILGEDPEQVVRVVFSILERHCTEGQISHVVSNLPLEVQTLWHQ